MNTVEPRLLVTIDTECDKSKNWRTASPLTFRGVTEAIPNRLQPLFARFGIRPTYLISPEVLTHPESVATLKAAQNVELTTHLHGDYIVPKIKTWDFAGSITDEMQWEYGAKLEREKLAALTELFRQQIGYQPLSFRAGRFGAGADTGKILHDLGYKIDSSVTPHVCWTSRLGVKQPDYRGFSELPYNLGTEGDIRRAGLGGLLELPVTILPAGTIAANTDSEPIWFRPWYSDAETLKRVVDHVIAQPPVNGVRRPLVMMFHNVELLAGASPYPQSEAEVQRYLDMMAAVFELAEKRGVKACTMAEYQAYHAENTVPAAAASHPEAIPPVVLTKKTLRPEIQLDAKLVEAALDRHGVQPWFKYVFGDRPQRWDCWKPCFWLAQNISPTTPVLSLGTGVGFNLFWLAEYGFTQLHGTDIDPKAVAAGNELAAQAGLPITLEVDDALAPKAFRHEKYGAIEALNWTHLLEGFSLDRLLDLYEPLLTEDGVFIMDSIDEAYNQVPGNQYSTQDRNKPEAERRPSEYRTRFSVEDIRKHFARHGLYLVEIIREEQVIPKTVYIGRRIPAAAELSGGSAPSAASPAVAAMPDEEKNVRALLAENPANLEALTMLLALCLDRDRWTEGEKLCHQILRLTPGNPDVLKALAFCVGQTGSVSTAISINQTMPDVAPTSAANHSPSAVASNSLPHASAITPISGASKRPRILLIADVPNWIFARHARTLQGLLRDEFELVIGYQGEAVNEDTFDLIYPLEWNLVTRDQIRNPAKWVTGIRSHCSWDKEPFGPFIERLRHDYQKVHAVSQRLLHLFSPHLPGVVCVSHGTDTTHFTATTRADQSGNKIRLGWAGNRKSVNKGFKEFIEPLGRLPGVELVFCGYADRNLTFDEMRDFYNQIDVYVCTSDFEGNNNSLMESAAMQRAIITTDNGTVGEYLQDGVSAIIVKRELAEISKAVIDLRDHPAKRVALGAQARIAVQAHFDWKVIAKHYAAFFAAALAGAKPVGAGSVGQPEARAAATTADVSKPTPVSSSGDVSAEVEASLVRAAKEIEHLNWPEALTYYRQAQQALTGNTRLAEAIGETIANLDQHLARINRPVGPVKDSAVDGFSFCLITNGKRPEKLRREIASIHALKIPRYEILVGGDVPEELDRVTTVPVPDAARNGRLGEMRNRLTERAKFGHVVVADDDMIFLPDFFSGLQAFGEDYEVQCVRFLNPDGTRYWDWATNGGPRGHTLLSYDETDAHVYVTGGLCIMKAEVARRVKWDEKLGYYKGEDIEFSSRLLAAGVSIKFNPHSSVIHHDTRFTQYGNIVIPVEALREIAYDYRQPGRELATEKALQRLRLIKPRLADRERVSLPVRWASPLFNPSGYASEAISFILPISQHLNLGINHHNNLYSPQFVAELPATERTRLQVLVDKFNFLKGGIFVSHNPAPGFLRTPDAVYHVGRTMYETDRIPSNWVTCCNAMDEVWVPSQFNVDTFAASGVMRDKLVIMPGSVDEALFDPAKHQPLPLPNRAKFNFVSVFEWSGRKAWDVLLAAYLREFSGEDDVCLYLRTYLFSRPDLDPRATLEPLIREFAATLGLGRKPLPRIELLTEQIPMRDLPRLYMAADCLVVPSRGEGWGRPMHEAMAMGRPVIATNWSANTEFMNEANSYLVDYELVDVKNVESNLSHYLGHRWANPSEQHLRRTMRRVQQNPDEAKAKGAVARTHVNTFFSRAAVGERVLQRLEAIERKFTTPSCPAVVTRQQTRAPDTTSLAQPAQTAAATTVAWDGSFLDYGSLSHVNREMTSALAQLPNLQLTRIGKRGARGPAGLQAIASTLKPIAPPDVQVTVRHSWPPVWDRPKSGKWVQIQPWEFGALPVEWANRAALADEIWTYTNYVRNLYITAGISPTKVKVVPLGIDPARFRPEATPVALSTRKSFKFLFVGGTIYRKGADLLLRAFLDSFTADDDVCLVIKDFGGNGAYSGQTLGKEIKAALARPNAPEILHLTEDMAPDALPGLYTACDCFVHPYRGEGFGLPVLEAMACALPVIVTSGGATDDFATDDLVYRLPAVRRSIDNRIGDIPLVTRGWLLEPDASALCTQMRWVLNHPEAARAKGQAASAHVRREWTWNESAAVAKNHLQRLASSPLVNAARERKTAPLAPPVVAKLGDLAKSQDLFRKKSPRAAWESAHEATQVRPHHPEAFLLLAEIARMVGDARCARLCATHALALAPGFKAARKFLKGNLTGTAKLDWLKLPSSIERRNQNAKPTVSACLIVKNEGRFLRQCLASVQPVVDQIVVVDTGSTDDTVAIAREFGAEIYQFQWCDDFSAARNAALEHVTGEWVMPLDADEELTEEGRAALLQHLQETAVISWRLPLFDIGREKEGCNYVPRLFRNAPGLHFVGRVHEQIYHSVEARRIEWGLENRLGTAVMRHHGYTQEIIRERGKVERNLRLLELAINEMPGDPLLHMNLGLELCRSDRVAEGITQYRIAFETMSALPAAAVTPETREALLTQYCTHLRIAKRPADLLPVLTSPLARQGELTASQHFLLGLAQMELEQFAPAAAQMRLCLQKREKPGFTPINPDILTVIPRHSIALCLWQTKDVTGANEAFQAALAEGATAPKVHIDYARFLHEQGLTAEALQLLHQFNTTHPDHAATWIAGGQIALSEPSLLEVALDWTGVAIAQHPNDPTVARQRAEAFFLSGRLSDAYPLWLQLSFENNPRTLAARIGCETALGLPVFVLPPAAVPAVSQEFVRWYWRLVDFGAEATILQLHGGVAALDNILPDAANLLHAAIAKLSATEAAQPV